MDVLHDNSFRQWSKIGSEILGTDAIPGYVREYSPMDKEAASALYDDEFADPGARMFPIDSPPNVWLSAAYFAANRNSLEPKRASVIEARIKSAANAWGVQLDVQKVLQDVGRWGTGTTTKQAAAADENYGWLVRDDQGRVIAKRYPMFDEVGVRKAAAYFAENRKHYPYSVKTAIAKNIMQAAGRFDVPIDELDEAVLKEAGYGVPNRLMIMRELNERARLSKDAESGVLLSNVNRLLGAASPDELSGNLQKIASLIHTFDQANDLSRHYGISITHPSDFLVSMTAKEAQDFVDKSIKLKRHIFDVTKLASEVSPNTFADVLGDAFIPKVWGEDNSGPANPQALKRALAELSSEDKGALERHLITTFS